MRTRWPLMVLLFVVPGSALTYCSPDLLSSAAPPSEIAAGTNEALAAPVPAASQPADGWRALPYAGANYGPAKVATVSFTAQQPIVVDDAPAAAQTPEAAPPAARARAPHRKCHPAKAAPAPKAGGLLEYLASTKDPAVPNKRLRNANCSDRVKRGG